MKPSLFDLHCDTAKKMLLQKEPLDINSFHVSLDKASCLERYVQVMALFTPSNLSDEDGWSCISEMWENLCNDPSVKSGKAVIVTSVTASVSVPRLLLSQEDARILCGQISRVDRLYEMGVRLITPLWSGFTCIGGAHDTCMGLTPFGKKAIERAVDLGMIPDISHASEASADEIFEIAMQASRPVIASHSNAHKICPVSRNLRDGQIQKIIDANGLIGINLYTHFLREGGNASISDVLRHIEYILSRGAEKHLALGCDMDGATLPSDLASISMLPALAEEMRKINYAEDLIRAIFFDNAYRFAKNYLH